MDQQKTTYQIIRNIFWSIITFSLGYCISFFITPYITSNLGVEAYGFIGLANNFISYIDIIAVAINAFAGRYIAMEYHNKKYKDAEEYYSSVVVANIIFTIITLIFISVFIVEIDKILNIPERLVLDIKILFLLVFINYCINLFSNTFALSAFIRNRAGTTSRNNGFGKIIYAIIIGFFVYNHAIKVYSLAVALIFASLFSLITNYYYQKRYTPEMSLKVSKFSLEKMKKLLASGFWNSINNVGNMLNSGLDLLVTNQLLSAVVMGQISITKQLANIITSLSFMISNAFQPKQLEAYSKGDINTVVDYLIIAMKCMGIMGGVLVAGFIAVGKDFYNVWIPTENINFLYNLTIIVLLGDVLVIVVRPLYYINTLTDKLKIVCWITIGNGIVNVIGMVILIKYMNFGGYAIVGTTMILNIIQSLLITPKLASAFLKLEDKNIFFRVVLRHLISTGVCIVLLSLIERCLWNAENWGMLLLKILILGAVGVITMLVGELSFKNIKKFLFNIRDLKK